MRPVRVLLGVPDVLVNVSRWSIESLLYPLGMTPHWVEAGAESTDIYYGSSAPDTVKSAMTFAFSNEAAATYESRSAVAVDDVTWKKWEGQRWPIVFRDPSGKSDIVAGAWFFLSGWQEVTTRARDDKGRFRFSDSLQARLQFAALPVVDAYREWLAREAAAANLTAEPLRWESADWTMCPTIDVDYLRKWRKGMVYREVVQRAILNRRRETLRGRLRRARSFASDLFRPNDVYRESLLRILHGIRSRGGTATIFLKTGAHGPHDVSYSTSSGFVRDVIAQAQDANFEIGLHPSYHASTHARYMADEVAILESLTGVRPRSVRQHYLRYEQPATLRLQLEAGFDIDSTLGFAEWEGFRRGTCVPFRLYDLYADRATALWEMPLAVMDGTLFNRRALSPEGALAATRQILEVCRRFGGCAVLLWHNVLWDELDAPGWGDHFEGSLLAAREMGGQINSLSNALDSWCQTD